MALRKISLHTNYMHTGNRGVTFIEIIIVLGLFAMLGKFALLISFDTYRQSSFHSTRASLISVLQHARAKAMSDVCIGATCTQGTSQGVFIESNQFVLFQGSSYALRDIDADEMVEANPATSHSGLQEIVFAASSGTVSQVGSIVLADTSGHISTTTIGSEGQISWSN